jgi:hypothetical protein
MTFSATIRRVASLDSSSVGDRAFSQEQQVLLSANGAPNAEIGNDSRQPARGTKRVEIVDRNGAVADVMLRVVLAKPIFAAYRLPPLFFYWIKRSHFPHIREIRESSPAIQTPRILEIDERATGVTVEGLHLLSSHRISPNNPSELDVLQPFSCHIECQARSGGINLK